MPLQKPTRPIDAAAFDGVVDFVNAREAEVGEVRTTADAAASDAAQAKTDAANAVSQVAAKYTRPASGIPASDLAAGVLLANAPGTPNNPITDPNAPRPAGLTVVWWDTYPNFPVNAQPQDQVDDRFTATAGTAGQPTGLASSNVTASSFTLSWTAAANAASYRVEHRPVGATSWVQSTTTGTSYNVPGLTAGTQYEARVTAVNSAGAAGTPSATVTVTTGATGTTSTVHAASFEGSLNGWAQVGGSSINFSTDRAAAGSYSLRVSLSAGHPAGTPAGAGSPGIPVAGGRTYTVRLQVSNASSGTRTFQALVDQYGAAGYLSTSSAAPDVTVASGAGFTTMSGTFTTAADATSVGLYVRETGSTAQAGDVFYLDDATVVG